MTIDSGVQRTVAHFLDHLFQYLQTVILSLPAVDNKWQLHLQGHLDLSDEHLFLLSCILTMAADTSSSHY